MKIFKLKKLILIIATVVTLVAPNVCMAVDGIANQIETNEIEDNSMKNENETEEEKENTVENNSTNENQEKEEETTNTENLETTNTNPEQTKIESTNQKNSVQYIENNSEPQQISTQPQIQQVEPGEETLQEAIKNAAPGSIIELKKGYYKGSDIEINKSITIRGAGKRNTYVYPKIILTDEDNIKNDVILESFSSNNQQPISTHIYYDIQKPVNLTMNNIEVFHITRSFKEDRYNISINLAKESNGSTIHAKNSEFRAFFEGISVNSSDNEIIFDNCEITSRLALRLQDGKNNNITFCNDSYVEGRSTYFREDEAISIVAQENLTINIQNSTVQGNDSMGDEITHLFSFDGEKPSHNVHISITGNSVINDVYAVAGSSMFNFGASNTENNSNYISISKDVTIKPNTVLAKYGNNPDYNYAMVGIFDKDGNLTIKAYNKGETVDGIEELPETKQDECTWYKKVKEETVVFDITENVTENMDLYPIFPEKIKINIEGKDYEIVKGKTLNQAFEKNSELKEILDNIKENDKFSRFVNKNDETITYDTPIIEDTTITPKYKVKVTVTVGDTSEEFELEEGQLLGEIKDKLAKFEKTDNKKFIKYVKIDNQNQRITMSSVITEDIEIKPIYNINIEIGEKNYELEEGKTLNDLTKTQIEEIEGIVTKENKIFTRHFKNKDGIDVKYDTQIFENTTLTPKYDVLIIIEKLDKTIKTYQIPENTSLAGVLGEQIKNEIETFVDEKSKTLLHFVDSNGKEVDVNSEITENTYFMPVYENIITITIKNIKEETKEYRINTGENLNSLDVEKLEEIKDFAKINNKILSHFVNENNEEIDFSTPIPERMTLTPKYKIEVKVTPKYDAEQTFEIPEGAKLETLNEELKQYENKENKKFKRYLDEKNSEVAKNKELTENITITPEYEITITVQRKEGTNKEIKVAEGTKLSSLVNELSEFESEVKDKKFEKYVNSENEEISKEKELTENTTIIPKYNIKVTIKLGENKKEYVIPEETVLHRLTEEEMNEIKEFVKVDNKEFADSFEDNEGNIIEFYTILNKNITLTPKYNVTVTIEEETYTLEEGQTLNDLTEEEKSKIEEIKNNHEEGEKFVSFIDKTTKKEVTYDMPILENIILEPIYEKIPTVDEEDKNDKTDEDKPNEDNSENQEDNITTNDEVKNSETVNPKTNDNIINYIMIGLVGIVCIAISIIARKKRK